MSYAEAAPGIETRGLTKSYGPVRVLDVLDLTIPAGSVFALLGPNGAGKTTTVRILATLTRPDGGSAHVAGADVVAQRSRVRRAISLTAQDAAVDGGQTGRENLVMVARLVGLSRREAAARSAELLDRVDLSEAADRRVATYSGGMRRRLDLAAGLVRRPQVMFLDEPTTGLDPRSRLATWDLVGEVAAAGTTVLLTTQYLEEADRLADRVGVLDRGRLVAEGTPRELKARVDEKRLELVAPDDAATARVLQAVRSHGAVADGATRTVCVPTDGSAAHVRRLLDEADPARSDVVRFAVRETTLDEVFLALTGHAQKESASV